MGAEYHGDGYELQWPYELKAIRSFRIERKFNTHARCTFTAVMTEEEAEACLLRSSFEDSLVFRKYGQAAGGELVHAAALRM